MWEMIGKVLMERAKKKLEDRGLSHVAGEGEQDGEWGWLKDYANQKAKGVYDEQGNFSPMDSMKQGYYDPMLGKNGVFNVTQDGPWRRG